MIAPKIMRHAFLLLPLLVLAGCQVGRQGTVSDDGRVASVVDGGTFVAGRGKIAEGGDDAAWSPNGQTLAIGTSKGALLWPEGRRVPGLGRPLAWSPLGDSLAGMEADSNKVKVYDVTNSTAREVEISGPLSAIRWMADGRILGVGDHNLQIESGATLKRADSDVLDAMPIGNGDVSLLEVSNVDSISNAIRKPIRWRTWSSTSGTVTGSTDLIAGELLGPSSTRRISFPFSFALAPNGKRFAVGGVRIESSPRAIARLLELGKARSLSAAQNKELDELLGNARKTSIVVRIDEGGASTPLWSSPLGKTIERIDLSWSPNGKWLAIAREDGTVRVAADG